MSSHNVLVNNLLQEAMNETFLLTNIAPQVGDGFNRHCNVFVECATIF